MFCRYFFTALLSVLVTLSPAIQAEQNTTQSNTSDLASKAASSAMNSSIAGMRTLKAFKQLMLEIKVLQQDAEQASGDSLTALKYRVLQKQLSGLHLLEKLSETIFTNKQQGKDISAIMEHAQPVFLAVGPAIIKGIKHENIAYNSQSSEAEKLTTDGLRIYLQHLDRVSLAYTSLTDITHKLERIGIDDGVSSRYLEDALKNRAEMFIGLLKINATKQAEIARILKISPTDEATILRKAILAERVAATIEHFRKTNGLLHRFNINTDSYQQYLIEISGEITTDMLDLKLFTEMLVRWSKSAVNYVLNNGIEIIFKVLIFVLILVGFKFLSNVVKRVLLKSLESSKLKLSSLMKEMVVSIAARLVMLLGLLIALSQLGFSLGPLLAGLGVAGFIIGFALQDTLGNFASGMMILIYRPYDVKDMVEAAGVFGEVKGMSLVSTTILTVDNQTLVIPNNKIWGDVIKNVTAQRVRRVDMVFGIGYSDDIEHAERLFMSILKEHKMVLASPAPTVKLHTLGESSVDFIVRPWVKTANYWDVYWDVTREVKLRLDREGLNIPFPQRDLHIYQTATPQPATES